MRDLGVGRPEGMKRYLLIEVTVFGDLISRAGFNNNSL